jgi:hypothetical protein
MNDEMIRTGTAEPKSPYHITWIVEKEYLTACAFGSRTRAVVSSLVTEISNAAIQKQCRKVLIDVRELQGWLGVFDSYYIVTKDLQRLRGKGIVKAAIVDRPLPRMREMFFQTVSHNRGFNLRIFEDPEAALAWLLGSQGSGETPE